MFQGKLVFWVILIFSFGLLVGIVMAPFVQIHLSKLTTTCSQIPTLVNSTQSKPIHFKMQKAVEMLRLEKINNLPVLKSPQFIEVLNGTIRQELSETRSEVKTLQDKIDFLSNELKALSQTILPETVLIQAKNLVEQGKIAQASLYFSNAIHKAPTNWDIIKQYTQSILQWSDKQQKVGEFQKVLEVLNEIETFLRSRVSYLALTDIKQLETMLQKIKLLKQSITLKRTQQQHQATLTHAQTLFNESQNLIKKPFPTEIATLSNYLAVLTDKQRNLQLMMSQPVVQNFLSVQAENCLVHDKIIPETLMIDKRGELKNKFPKSNECVSGSKQIHIQSVIANLEAKIDQVQTALQASSFIIQIQALVETAQQKSLSSKMGLYYLNGAQSLFQQLILFQPTLPSLFVEKIKNLSKALETISVEIARRQSQPIFAQIKAQKSQIEAFFSVTTDLKCQEAMTYLADFKQYLVEKMMLLTASEMMETTQAYLKQSEKALAKWQTEQVRRYEQWAIEKIKHLYDQHSEQLSSFTDTDELIIYEETKSHLGIINTRYLSSAAATAYNEVFSQFYRELDDEQKIALTAEMTLMPKCTLSDF